MRIPVVVNNIVVGGCTKAVVVLNHLAFFNFNPNTEGIELGMTSCKDLVFYPLENKVTFYDTKDNFKEIKWN